MFLKRPELYHGYLKKGPFFEGWYHKMSSKNGQTFVVIPGIYKSGVNNNQTAFLMLYQGSNGKVDYIPFNVNKLFEYIILINFELLIIIFLIGSKKNISSIVISFTDNAIFI